ncbi:MAG TPA: condensation domain-containing protein, partial [Longimicrobium sp.]|nr:condensation domain-containing protein [Longimicrobium sp.]
MNRKNVEDIYPLSPLQEGMLFHAVYSAGKGAYVEQWPLLLEGPLDVDAFHRAFQRVVDRHPALRTAFVWENVPRPLQVVFRAAEVPCERLVWSDADEAEWPVRLESYAAERRAAGFALGTAPLVRLTLARLSGERHLLLFAFHHLLMDGWSAPLVFEDWWVTYDGLLRGTPPHLPPAPRVRDYVAWLQAQDASAAEHYWRETLRGFTEVTSLPLARGGPDVAEEHAAESLLIAGDAGARLLTLARDLAVTPNTVVQGAWALLLSRYAGRDDVVFGATVSGRPAGLPGVERMVGLFINTLPVRVWVDADQPVRGWLTGVQHHQAEARQHEHARLLDVQGWSEAPREHPLFGSLVVFENYPLGQGGDDEDGGGLRMKQLPAPEGSTYPLTLVVAPKPDGLELRLSYDLRRFSPAAARRMVGGMDAILRAFADAPDAPLGSVDALPAEDRAALAAWGAGDPVDGAPALAHADFERWAAQAPDGVAVAWAGGELTYGELNARADTLARRLVAAGVGPESAVGVCLPRGADAVVALLAVLKAGGVYLPLDPAYPADRLGWMLEDARAAALVADDAGRALLSTFAGPVLPVGDAADASPTLAPSHARTFTQPSNGAYLVYTSGSTGLPKGVLVQHTEAAAHMRDAAARTYGYGPGERVLQFAAPGFDVALEQVLAPLSAGAALVLRPAEVPGPAELVALLRETGVTVFNPPTAYWHALMGDADAVAAVRALVRLTLVGGEAMQDAAARHWLATSGGGVLLNGYGPTETIV